MNPKENSLSERLINGLLKENPTFVLMLGMCPTLAVTTSAANGLGMGMTTLAVLALSNLLISLLRNIIPDRMRIPAFIVVIATFVTVVELLLKAYLTFLYDALGLYIPLIVVNCIILGRAEAYASKNRVALSFFDGIGMGLGFTLALTIIGAIREVIGAGELFGYAVMPEGYVPSSIFVMAPGAFFVLAVLTAIQNKVKRYGEKKGKDMSRIQSGCSTDCLNCEDTGCRHRIFSFGEDETAIPAATVTNESDRPYETIDLDMTFEFIDLDESNEKDGTDEQDSAVEQDGPVDQNGVVEQDGTKQSATEDRDEIIDQDIVENQDITDKQDEEENKSKTKNQDSTGTKAKTARRKKR